MKHRILLTILLSFIIAPVIAQKKLTAFAITGTQKGHGGWKEVRIIDMNSGEEVQSIYKNEQVLELLNARTGKAIVKKEPGTTNQPVIEQTISYVTDAKGNAQFTKRKISDAVSSDLPFATNSAACAYDKKHERLYYTPMGVNQLRYIDLKSKTPKIYYFENEPFGALNGPRDIPNQITRMVIGADGNGYALTNNANHLIRFTTGKKATITNLGAITDAASNGSNTIHHQNAYGGDLVAHRNGALYLITANRKVFKINVDNRTAGFIGEIQGLPKGFTTNGAMVDEGMNVIVCSSNSTQGYFRFDMNKLQAEKITAASTVFNASDLASSNLLSEKKKKKKEMVQDETFVIRTNPEAAEKQKQKPVIDQLVADNSISMYPNPIAGSIIKMVFRNQPEGKYIVQFMDISGKLVGQQQITINNKFQVQEIRLPSLVTAGNYLVKILNQDNQTIRTEKLLVQQ